MCAMGIATPQKTLKIIKLDLSLGRHREVLFDKILHIYLEFLENRLRIQFDMDSQNNEKRVQRTNAHENMFTLIV